MNSLAPVDPSSRGPHEGALWELRIVRAIDSPAGARWAGFGQGELFESWYEGANE